MPGGHDGTAAGAVIAPRRIALTAIALIGLALGVTAGGCRRNQQPPPPAAPLDPAPPPMIVSDQDREMNAAMAEGKRTLPRLLEALAHPPPGAEAFAIKATFRQKDQVEHMWLHEPRVVGDRFEGVLSSDPTTVEGYRNGERLSVGRDQIVDWSYIKGGVLVGGYTLREMFKRVPAAERPALLQELGYRFE